MRFHWIAAALAAVMLSAGPAPALAQVKPAAADANAHALALVCRYLAAIHFEAQMDTMLASMLPMMVEQQAKLHPEVSKDQQAMILETTRELMRDKFTPKMLERVIPIYAQAYSVSELEAIVAFYEGPTGQAIVTKGPTIAPKVTAVTRDLMPELMVDMITAMCAKMNCQQPATPMPKPTPS